MTGPDPESAMTVEALIRELLERRSRGERPTVEEYAGRYPELADEILECFPALGPVEDSHPSCTGADGPPPDASSSRGIPVVRLGDFRILREVGRGGMAIVYEAEQESLGRRVALKVFGGTARIDARMLARLQREARAAAGLHHTNIVPVLGIGEHQGYHFLVMPFIPGSALDAVIAEARRLVNRAGAGASSSTPGRPVAQALAMSLLSGRHGRVEAIGPGGLPADSMGLAITMRSAREYTRTVARIGWQLSEALAYAHEKGLLHRNVRPSNVLLDVSGTPWLADFGLSGAVSENDVAHARDVVGAFRFLAPERFLGRCDARSDVYALGLTLYEMLALRPAFAATERNALVLEITQEAPRRLRRFVAAVPRDLDAIVHKAIEKEPSRRYATAEALADDLGRFLEDRPIAARRLGPAARLVRWGLRSRGIAALAILGFGLSTALAVAAAVAAFRGDRARERAELEASRARSEARRAGEALAGPTEALAQLRTSQGDLRHSLYAARMSLAQEAWERGSLGRVDELLARTRPAPGESDPRGFEWHYLRRLAHRELHARKLPKLAAGAAFSADAGRLAALVSRAGHHELVAWETASGLELFARKLPASLIARLAFSGDGTRLALAAPVDAEGEGAARWRIGLNVWEVPGGREVFASDQVTPKGPLGLALAMSPDGKRVARALTVGRWADTPVLSGDLKVWEVADAREVRSVAADAASYVSWIGFSPDGTRLVAALDRVAGPEGEAASKFLAWDIATGNELASVPDLAQHVGNLAYSPDGERLVAFGSDLERRRAALSIRESATGRPIRSWIDDGTGPAEGTLSPDGRRAALFSAAGPSVRIWDLDEGRLVEELKGHAGGVFAARFRPDGNRLVTVGQDHTLKEWDVSGRDPSAPGSLPRYDNALNITLGGDATRFAVASRVPDSDEYDITVREAATGGEVRRIHVPITRESGLLGLSLSPDGSVALQYAAPGPFDEGREVVGWDVATGRPRYRIRDEEQGGRWWTVAHPRLDAGRFAVAVEVPGAGSRIQVRDIATGRLVRTLAAPAGPIHLIAISPDGKRLAGTPFPLGTSPREEIGQVTAWEGAEGSISRTLRAGRHPLGCLAFSPDGRSLAAGTAVADSGGEIVVWDLEDGRERLRLSGHAREVTHLAFSPDGRRLASTSYRAIGGKTAHELKLWELGRGHEVLSRAADEGVAVQLAFSPDGRRLYVPLLDQASRTARLLVLDARPALANVVPSRR